VILSGDLNRDDGDGDGLADANTSENAYHVFRHTFPLALDSTARLDSVVIRSGRGSSGGAIYNDSSSPALTNCTLAGNSASRSGGAIYNYYYYSSPRLTNCIVWGNQGNGQVYGGSVTASHCIIQGGFSGGTEIVDADPLLLPLGDYGGPTPTMALGYGSPAIDSGLASSAPPTDQRGFARDAAPDTGACEYVPGIDNDFTYAHWAAAHGLADDDALPGADPDADGISNLMECASNLIPTIPDRATLTPGTGTSGLARAYLSGQGAERRLAIEFVRRRGNTGLIYIPEACSDPAGSGLDGWQPASGPVTVTPIDGDWERVIVEDDATIGTHPRRFIRLRIEQAM